MWEVECPVCHDAIVIDNIRSLPCGHACCLTCIERWVTALKEKGEDSQCPVCRTQFFENDIRRIYITPVFSGEGAGVVQTEGQGEDEVYVKEARYIAKKLGKMGPDTGAGSVQNAVEMIGRVAVAPSERAQSILWAAVRGFWERLVPMFEEREDLLGIRDLYEVLKDSTQTKIDELQREVARQRDVAAENMGHFKSAKAEIKSLKKMNTDLQTAIHQAENADKAEYEGLRQEVSSYQGMLAQLKLAERRLKADLKALKQKTKQQELEIQQLRSTGYMPEEESQSLYVEPPPAAESSTRHVLDVYGEDRRSPKRRKVVASNTDTIELDDFASEPSYPAHAGSSSPPASPSPPDRTRRERPSHKAPPPRSPSAALPPPKPAAAVRPRFHSEWTMGQQPPKPIARADSGVLPFAVDARGRPSVLCQAAPRQRVKLKKQ
ncbi:hypothetical protein BV25DRAFT_1426175 [Artomyces pyxidatus]|uniref:Uncharacterized protein n=1 Tax=Artomyces pyxidatus TaxID=48021 RepID=A0ACB8SNE9_9AGAM|nr:hypothetical protein BV25DRAFT_1426175 [Artomyces pyxidatus]